MGVDLSSQFSCAIAVMAKASVPGHTKTRLTPFLTPVEAASLNTAFLKDAADNMLAAGRQAPIRGVMAFGPPGSEAFFRNIVPPRIHLLESWFPNFGICLFHAATNLLETHGAVCLVNSDSPTLPTRFFVEAAEALARPGDRIVFGPASDGGYYLLGIKTAHRRLFEDIAWSTEHTGRQTLEHASELGLEVHHLPAWYDVDDTDALRCLYGELFEDQSFGGPNTTPFAARHTIAAFHQLLNGADLYARLWPMRAALPRSESFDSDLNLLPIAGGGPT
jgi:uncharacterized protein